MLASTAQLGRLCPTSPPFGCGAKKTATQNGTPNWKQTCGFGWVNFDSCFFPRPLLQQALRLVVRSVPGVAAAHSRSRARNPPTTGGRWGRAEHVFMVKTRSVVCVCVCACSFLLPLFSSDYDAQVGCCQVSFYVRVNIYFCGTGVPGKVWSSARNRL